VIFPFATVIRTWTVPHRVSTALPVNVPLPDEAERDELFAVEPFAVEPVEPDAALEPVDTLEPEPAEAVETLALWLVG
jgi:hypothetical protein